MAASVLPPEVTATCGIPMYPLPSVAVDVVPSAGKDVVFIVEDPIETLVTLAVNTPAAVALVERIVGLEPFIFSVEALTVRIPVMLAVEVTLKVLLTDTSPCKNTVELVVSDVPILTVVNPPVAPSAILTVRVKALIPLAMLTVPLKEDPLAILIFPVVRESPMDIEPVVRTVFHSWAETPAADTFIVSRAELVSKDPVAPVAPVAQ